MSTESQKAGLLRLLEKHTQQPPLPRAGNNKTFSCFNLGLKPKRKPDPLTVWLVHGAVFSARAHGEGSCGSMPVSVRLLRSHELIRTCLNRLCPSLWACLRSRLHRQTKPKPHEQRALLQWLHRSSCQSWTSSLNLGKGGRREGGDQLTVTTSSCITVLKVHGGWDHFSRGTYGRSLVFLHIKLLIRIFTIMYKVLHHYYDGRCSPESWSSLLASPPAENNEGAKALS